MPAVVRAEVGMFPLCGVHFSTPLPGICGPAACRWASSLTCTNGSARCNGALGGSRRRCFTGEGLTSVCGLCGFHLTCQGFSKIQNLDEYTGLKVIWLEGNGLTRIEGLDCQLELSTLYLQENVIERIENLSHLHQLNTLNLSKVGNAPPLPCFLLPLHCKPVAVFVWVIGAVLWMARG